MLVLSRKPKESICMGIEAPVEMPVHRQEVHEEIMNREVLGGVASGAGATC